MLPFALRWTNLAIALVAIGGLAVAVVPIGGTGATGEVPDGAPVATPAAPAPVPGLAPRGVAARPPPPQAPDELTDALARSAADPGVSSPKPPLPRLSGGGRVAFNPRGDRVASEAGRGVVLWDTATWTVVATIEIEGKLSQLFFSPDGRHIHVGWGGREPFFARYDTTTGRLDPDFSNADAERHVDPLRRRWGAALRVRGLETPPSTSSTVATCDDPDLLVLVNREVEPGLWDEPGTLTLCRRTGDAWDVVKEVRLETARSLDGARLSRSGRLLAAAGPGNVVRVYAVPDLRERGRVRFAANRASRFSVGTLEFSPDEGLLVVDTSNALPGLVRIPADPEEPIAKTFPWVGHADRVVSARFTPDGTRVLTHGVDQTVCLWNARTLELEKRYSLPDGFEAVAEEDRASPWILCAPEDEPGGIEPNGWPVKVVEAQSGELLFDTHLPPGLHPDGARRMPDGTLLLVHDKLPQVCRFDCARGVIVSTVATTDRVSRYGLQLSNDHLSLRVPPSLGKGTFTAELTRIDLRTGEVVERRAPSESWVHASACGFVPGERYLFSAGTELILYAQDTLEVVARRPFSGRWPMITFSGDGNRYATRVERKTLPEATRRRLPPEALEVVSVHETLSGRTLLAVPLVTDAARLLLDADGGRLVVVGEDGRLTRWTLPPDVK